ncbi:hypothetical protein TNCT_186661, partial [Trichonephila clavata]
KHFEVLLRLACRYEPESYAGDITATGRASRAGFVEKETPDYEDPKEVQPFWALATNFFWIWIRKV